MKEFEEIRDVIAERRPELVQEWKGLESRSPHEAAEFLTKHFPIPGGWWAVPVVDAPQILRRWHPRG